VSVLQGIKVVEIAGLGAAPFTGMMLADMGAEVLLVQRPGSLPAGNTAFDVSGRGKTAIELDLKNPADRATLLKFVAAADVLLEGFRPGVMERLELAPETLLAHNSRLIYGRMTGYGQGGERAQEAGHDINYISLTGALHAMGQAGGKPTLPLNLLGDFAGGGLMLAFGVVSALLRRHDTGRGEVIDTAMADGVTALMGNFYSARQVGFWSDKRGTNLLDSGAHFYDVYETSDGGHMAVGAIEDKFYQNLLSTLGIEGEQLPAQMDDSQWPAMRSRLAEIFKQKSRDQWTVVFSGREACVTPVLNIAEAVDDSHLNSRQQFYQAGDARLPMPAPRFQFEPSATPSPLQVGDTAAALAAWGCTDAMADGR